MPQKLSDGETSEEAILVRRATKHDADAFGRLYVLHVDRVYRHIYYRVGNETDAEDLTQQVFLKAWQAIHRYKRTKTPFIAWLMTISHNLIVDFFRTRKDLARLDAELVADTPASSPEYTVETSLQKERVHKAILQLNDDEQQVIMLRLVEGFEFAEIASLLGKKEGNIRVILHRALVKLRKILENEERGERA